MLLAVTPETMQTHLYAGLNVDGGDLLDDLGGTVEVNHSLVDPHLELVPGLTTLSAGSLTGGDPQGLSGHPDGPLHLQLLVFGSLDQVAADLLQGLDVAGGQSDSDAMDGGVLLHSSFAILTTNTSNIRVQLLPVKYCGKATIKTPAMGKARC